jgi:hypothetical protein
MFPGGIADKIGNRFEAKWAVRHLLEVFFAKAKAIRFESIDPTDHGVEFSVKRDDFVEWHQTKRCEGGGNWTVNRLRCEGVLDAALTKLTSDDKHVFVFVSETPAKVLHDLPGKAKVATTWQQFEETLSENERTVFFDLRTIWKEDSERTWNYIKRTRFEVISEASLQSFIKLFAGIAFNESDEIVFPILRDYLEENFNRELTTEVVRYELTKRGVSLRLQVDPTLRERIERATQYYLDSYIPFGAGGCIIARREAEMVLSELKKEQGPTAILLTGNAGSGKSGVVRQVISNLIELDKPHLAFRVDRNLAAKSPEELGEVLYAHREHPVVALRCLAATDGGYLIIDQIDAISEASGRIGAMRDVVFDLIRTARVSGNIRVLAICRSFDLSTDQTLREMEQLHDVTRVEVKPLDWESEVQPLLLTKGLNPARLSQKQRTLLTLPLNLSIFLDVTPPGAADIPFSSTSDLFDELIARKQRSIRQAGFSDLSIPAVISTLASIMSEAQTLDASIAVLDIFPSSVDVLAREHLIVRTGGSIAFFHESFFDYAFARSFVREGKKMLDLLRSDEQFLFRRTQIRQILTAYRQSGNHSRYLRELRDVLTSGDVRFHLKDAVAKWLATLDDPSEGDLDVLLSLDHPHDEMPYLIRVALSTQPQWFPLLHHRGLWDKWLNDDTRRGIALHLLRNAVRLFAADVAGLLRRWWNNDAERGDQILGLLWLLPDAPASDDLLSLNLDLIRAIPQTYFDTHGAFERLSIETWLKKDPLAAGKVLEAWFAKWFEYHPEGHPFLRGAKNDLELHTLNEFQERDPGVFLEVAVPVFIETIRRINMTYDGTRLRDSTWQTSYRNNVYDSGRFITIMITAIRKVASVDPDRAKSFLRQIDPEAHTSATFLYLEAIAAEGRLLGDLLPEVLHSRHLFSAGPSSVRWLSLAEAAKAAFPHLPAESRTEVEHVILANYSELRNSVDYLRQCRAQGEEISPESRRWIVNGLGSNGYIQWCILKTIDGHLLSAEANRQLERLERKFRGWTVRHPPEPIAKFVPPPISRNKAAHMSDDQWIEAMRTYADDQDRIQHNGRLSFHTGARGLSQVLRERAKEEPERFADLFVSLPPDIPHDYRDSILWGLSESQVSDEILVVTVRHARAFAGAFSCGGISRILEARPSVGHDDEAFEALVDLVKNGRVESEGEREVTRVSELLIDIKSLLQGMLGGHSFYPDRGLAVGALAEVLWECEERKEKITDVLKSRLNEEQAESIRCHFTSVIYSLLKYDDYAVAANLLMRLVMRQDGVDLKPLATWDGIRGLYYILHGAPDKGRKLLNLLLESDDDNMRGIGAYHLFREAFYDETLARRADDLIWQNTCFRQVAADAAANHLPLAEYQDRAERQLVAFFDDPEKEVRVKAANCFRNVENRIEGIRSLIHAFVRSKAFEDDNFALFLLLNETKDQSFEEVVLAAERVVDLVESKAKVGEDFRASHYLDDLIRREYLAVADCPDLRRRLLDVIDRMLQNGLYGTDKIIEEHERL